MPAPGGYRLAKAGDGVGAAAAEEEEEEEEEGDEVAESGDRATAEVARAREVEAAGALQHAVGAAGAAVPSAREKVSELLCCRRGEQELTWLRPSGASERAQGRRCC